MQLKDLNPGQAQRLSALLDEAMDLAPQQRAAWQADLAQREPQLYSLAADVLASMDAAGREHLLETSDLIHRHLAQATHAEPSFEGRAFGPWRVLRLLGQGGMGSVWLAERADGLFSRQVALKLVHASLFGSALAQRFVRERSILAALDHPHIARLLDAGVADDGQPYLALEYVEGIPLTAYCDAERLPLAARIALVVQALSAVQHAHQNLVVHRDLKPSNILVTRDGQVRLLDFGIAKLMVEGEARETELTQVGGRALTLDYASPEQIAGQPVSTASDVYSLGVLLYELLCGQRPYHVTRDSRGALEQAILDVDPAKPSHSAIREDIATARSTTAKKLRQTLGGDLDTIVLKALKKNPAERYATADAFMQDLQRYLAGEVVAARPDSASYRLGKFVARHRVATATAGAFVLLLAIGVGLVVRETAIASREAQTARAVEDFLLQIFRYNSRDQKDPVKARLTTARELLDIGTGELMSKLDAVPGAKQEILAVLARMYYELGLTDQAVELNRQRVEVVRALNGDGSLEAAHARVDYAQALYQKGDFPKLEPVLLQAKAALDAIHDTSSAQRVSLLALLATFLGDAAPDKAIAYAEEAVAICRRHYPGSKDLGDSLNILARARYDLGEYDVAEKLQREAVDTFTALGANGTLIATSQVLLGGMQMKVLKIAEAEQNFRSGFEIMRKANGDNHLYTLHAQFRLGRFLHATARRAEGLALMLSALQKAEQTFPPEDPGVIPQFRGGVGSALLAEGRVAEASKDIDLALKSRQQNFPGGEMHAIALEASGELLITTGKYLDAEHALDQAVDIRRKIGGPAGPSALAMDRIRQGYLALARDSSDAASQEFQEALGIIEPSERGLFLDGGALAKLGLADTRERQHNEAAALRLANEVLQAVQRSALRDYFKPLEADALLRIGSSEHALRDLDAARASIDRALKLRQELDSNSSPWLAQAQITMADCYLDLGKRDEAQKILGQAKAIHATLPELGEQFKAPLRRVAARLGG